MELVRYIHLNPLRARLVSDLDKLASFPYSGHGILSGTQANDWQNVSDVFALFAEEISQARHQYIQFIQDGVAQGRRSDLTGGGLVRSVGGWVEVRELGKSQEFYKSDERILGNSSFVDDTLKAAEEFYLKRQALRSHGITLDNLLDVVAEMTGVPKSEIMEAGKSRSRVQARSLLCYWAVRELGLTMTELAMEIGLSVPAISMSVQRGAKVVAEKNVSLAEKINLKT